MLVIEIAAVAGSGRHAVDAHASVLEILDHEPDGR
jgi:hypothetical protein